MPTLRFVFVRVCVYLTLHGACTKSAELYCPLAIAVLLLRVELRSFPLLFFSWLAGKVRITCET
jgi:hypothetical protein